MDFALEKRQALVDNNGTSINDDGFRGDTSGNFWYSEKAEIIKWAIVGGITLFFLLWFVGGYVHAKRRLKKGLKPLRYHRFLIPRDQRARFEPQNNFSFYRQDDQGYRMDAFVPPPPVYNSDHPMPPEYVPPQGGSKANPSQEWIAPPPGAPPIGPTADEEAGLKAEKASRFAKFKPTLPKHLVSSKLNPFSK